MGRERWRDAGGKARAAASGGTWPGKMLLRIPGLGLECGRYREIERDTGNRSRAVGGDQIGRGYGVTASGGLGTPTSSCGHGEVAGEGKEGASEGPHHHVVLRGWSFDGKRQWSGGAATARGGDCDGALRATVCGGGGGCGVGEQALGSRGLNSGGCST
jgi:hypothetical protein